MTRRPGRRPSSLVRWATLSPSSMRCRTSCQEDTSMTSPCLRGHSRWSSSASSRSTDKRRRTRWGSGLEKEMTRLPSDAGALRESLLRDRPSCAARAGLLTGMSRPNMNSLHGGKRLAATRRGQADGGQERAVPWSTRAAPRRAPRHGVGPHRTLLALRGRPGLDGMADEHGVPAGLAGDALRSAGGCRDVTVAFCRPVGDDLLRLLCVIERYRTIGDYRPVDLLAGGRPGHGDGAVHISKPPGRGRRSAGVAPPAPAPRSPNPAHRPTTPASESASEVTTLTFPNPN